MGIYLKNSTGWKNLKELYIKNSTGWKQIKTAYLKNSTGWKLLFSSSLTPTIESGALISKSTNATTKLITLTGTNFHWFNSTGITYRFQYSSDGASFYNLIGATTISNPTLGGSNTATYALSTSEVQPNVDNVYKFIVTATNSTYGTTAASEDSLTISGIRDITGLSSSTQGYTSLDFSWGGGTYANAFIYEYQEYTGGVGGTWSGEYATANYFISISNLSPNTDYRIRVKGISGTTTTNPGYSGNWAYATAKTLTPSNPNVTTYPTISGTAVAKTTVTSGNGSYSNYSSGIAVQSRIIAITNPALIVQGDTAPQGNVVSVNTSSSSQTYEVTQADATNKSYYFFARDTVFSLDGVTAYYYYSNGIKSTMGTVTDNFNRTVANGLGTMSSGFTYSGNSTSPSWSVNGSVGIASATPTALSGPDTWGLRSIEMGGKTDISMSVDIPSAAGGTGLAFWVTGNTSWWSANCYQAPETTTSYSCTGAQQSSTTNPGAEGTTTGAVCEKTSSISYACNQSGSSSTTYPSNVGTGAGQVCSVTSSSEYPCNQSGGSSTTSPSNQGTGSGQVCNVNSSTSYECNQFGGSSTTGAPATGSGPGGVCNVVSQTLYDCNGSQQSSTTDPGSESSGSGGICNKSSSYVCNTGSGSSSQTYPSNVGTGSGQVCNVQTSTSYQFQFFATSSAPTQSTVSTCNATNVGRAQTGSIQYGSFGNVIGYNRCNTVTLYSWNNRNTFLTYTWQTRSTSGTTTYYWNKRTTTPTTTYTWNTRSTSLVTTYSWFTRTTTPTTTYFWKTIESSTTTVYNTSLRIYQASGSSVTMKDSNLIDGNSIGYLSVSKINLSTSGDTITASLRNSSNNILGTATVYTPSSPTKADIFGSSAFGLSKGYSAASSGNEFDNLSIS